VWSPSRSPRRAPAPPTSREQWADALSRGTAPESGPSSQGETRSVDPLSGLLGPPSLSASPDAEAPRCASSVLPRVQSFSVLRASTEPGAIHVPSDQVLWDCSMLDPCALRLVRNRTTQRDATTTSHGGSAMSRTQTSRDERRRTLSQNFLVTPRSISRFLDAAELERDDEVVEVGAGSGALTGLLADRCARLVAYEVDRSWSSKLEAEVARRTNIEIVYEDFLSAVLPTGPIKVVGNI